MKPTPLVQLAAARIPALTEIFSDTLELASMDVVAGGLVTLTCRTTMHGVPTGSKQAVCVVDALTPNPITHLELLPNKDVRVTTQYDHELTTTPDATLLEAWDAFAIVSGTGVIGLDGNRQLVAVETSNSFVVRPGGTVTLPGTIPAGAAHLDRLERQLTGWHVATAASATTLTFPAPPTVVRDYSVPDPQVATNIRVWGAVDIEHALEHFTRLDDKEAPIPSQGYLFITPIPHARLSRSRESTGDAMTEIQPGQTVRQKLLDGFEVYAVLPSEESGGAVACMDKAHGPILRAVMRTFNGLRMPYTEFAMPAPFISMMTGHGMARYTRANYVHQYTFESTVLITNDDCAAPIDIPDVTDIDAAIVAGQPVPLDPVQPVGSVPFNGGGPDGNGSGFTFGPDPAYGIWQSNHPQPLTANIALPPA